MTNQKRLTEEQFSATVKEMQLSQKTIHIAHGVLVEGRQYSEYVQMYGMTRSAVSQSVMRVWNAADLVPPGFERVTAVLPAHQAFVVRKWAVKAKTRIREMETS